MREATLFERGDRVFTLNFDTASIGFREWAEDIFEFRPLEKLHTRIEAYPVNYYEHMDKLQAQLQGRSDDIANHVRELFSRCVEPSIGCLHDVFQVPPTFRVHLSGCGSISAFHLDSDYGMPEDHATVWLPLTNVAGANSLWIFRRTTGEMEPVTLSYGQFIVFDSASTLHGSVSNDSEATRISFDCRFMPRRLVDEL
jgi:hypothetical protein